MEINKDNDLMEMMKKAQMLYGLLNGEGNVPDEERISHMMNMMQMLQSAKDPGYYEQMAANGSKQSAKTPEVLSEIPTAKSMKAILPYLPPTHQRNVSILIKLLEINYLLHNCNEFTKPASAQPEHWQHEMLIALRPHLPEPNQRMIDTLVQWMEWKRIMELYGNGNYPEYI